MVRTRTKTSGPPHSDPQKHNQFVNNMKLIFESSKDARKKKPSAAHRKLAREYMQQKAQASLRHTERALGLRPLRPHIPEITPDTPWNEEVRIREARKNVLKPPPIHVNSPPPWQPQDYSLLVSLDVECYEWDKSKVTEIGIAVLDTRKIVGVAPGPEGIDWHDLIEARHYRIREHSFYQNKNFVAGCADKFDFGESEVISKYEAKDVLRFWFESGWEDWVDEDYEDDEDDEDDEYESDSGEKESEKDEVPLVAGVDGTTEHEETPPTILSKEEPPSTPKLGTASVAYSSPPGPSTAEAPPQNP